ncbi:MAG: hypothetical protein IJ063_04130 [Ruminococcus sp.]|nr:hypothetical protein [Ruminococcus sp.]
MMICSDIEEDRLREMVSRLRILADNADDVSFALGTVWESGSYDVRRLMQQADENMYRDKDAFYRRHPEKERRKRER